MLSWRTLSSSPKFFYLCGRHRLKAAMWSVPIQRSFRIVSVPSGKLTGWLARLWLSPRRIENPPARKWCHPRRRLLDLVFNRLGSPTSTPQRTVTQESPFRAGAGRARPRPFQGSKKSAKASSSTSTRQRWRVPGGGWPGRLCPALAESAGQLPGHRHRRGRGGHCFPATASAHPSKHQFPDQEQPSGPSASSRWLADEGSHRAGLHRVETFVLPLWCRPSCSDASGCPQVSVFRGQQEGVPVHLSSVWTGYLSTRVHQAAANCRLAV